MLVIAFMQELQSADKYATVANLQNTWNSPKKSSSPASFYTTC